MPLINSIRLQFIDARQKTHSVFSRYGWLIALVAVLLFALMLWLIFYIGVLDSDAIEYAYYAYGAAHGDFQLTGVPRDIQFRLVLYLPLSLLFILFGNMETAAVIYVTLVSLLGIILMYCIGRLLANESAGLISALVWTTLPINLFLSTRFGPDEILATYTIASVFFLLWGAKLSGRRAFYCYSLGFLLGVLGVFVKPSAVIIFVFLAVFWAIKAFESRKYGIRKRIARIKPSLFKAVKITGGFLVLGLGFWYFQVQPQSFLISLFRASSDLANLFVLGSTQEDVRGQWILHTDLFLVAAPLFIVALTGAIVKRLAGSAPPLLWVATLFLYFEWGSRNTNPALYTPFQTVVNDRNTLFIFAPFVVIVGIFFAQWIKTNQARWLAIFALMIILPITWVQKRADFAGIPGELIAFTAIVAIIGIFVVPTYLNSQTGRYKPVLATGFVAATLVAFLYPTPPLHFSADYWQSQIRYRRVVKQVAQYFLDHPDYPILTLSGGNARELNFLSNFELGYSVYGVEQPNARIQRVPDPKTWKGSAYIFLRDEINQIQPVPNDWWKIAEYDVGSEKPVLVYRHLSAEDAAAELTAAKLEVENEGVIANWERLLAAGINAGDVSATVEAWMMLSASNPEGYSLELISPFLIESYYENDLSLGGDLLAVNLVGNLDAYQLDSDLVESKTTETVAGEAVLTLKNKSDQSGRSGLYKRILLEPDSLYLFTIEVQSDIGVDLLRVQEGEITDSHDYSDIYGEWQDQAAIFVTPSWDDEMNVRIDLLTFTKLGFVQIKNPHLYKVDIAQP